MFRISLGVLVSLAAIIPAAAADPPKELFGKSIVVMWSEMRSQRNVGHPNFRDVTASQALSVYVSLNGRVFNRFALQTRAGTGKIDQVAGSEGANRVPIFDERTLRMNLPFRTGGARQVDVSFAEGFESCSAKVDYKKPPDGTRDIGFSPITKKSQHCC